MCCLIQVPEQAWALDMLKADVERMLSLHDLEDRLISAIKTGRFHQTV